MMPAGCGDVVAGSLPSSLVNSTHAAPRPFFLWRATAYGTPIDALRIGSLTIAS